ncbi:MAG TPA: YfiR family protein [Steroidobacteraceae bacterium]|nr:YfiR family protein [Steroidobacteraceae bacterium]
MRVLAGTTAWLAALLLAAASCPAQGAEDTGVKLRVATAIARFVELPARRGSTLKWCVAAQGKPPAVVLALEGQKVGSMEVQLQLAAPFHGCDVLYVDASVADWRALLAASEAPVLTVSDIPGFIAGGGMVELVIESDSVRFDVNLRALRAQSIRLPPQVLSLARQVRN